MSRLLSSALLTAVLAGASSVGHAAVITDTLGNGASGLSNGTVYDFIPTISAAQTGSPAPFNAGCGFILSNCDTSWTHVFAPIADTILSASLTIGIYDAGSASAGDQVAELAVDSADITAAANTAFEANKGAKFVYNEYTIALGAALFASLADGSAVIDFGLQGPVDAACPIFNPGCADPGQDNFNAASLIFSTLSITTRDPTQVPLPGSLALLSLGGLLLGFFRRPAGRARRAGL